MSTTITLTNQSSTGTLYAFVTGTDNSSDVGAPFFIQSDGKTVYYPANTTGPLAVDCGIQVGAVGASTTATIPFSVTGGRIWYSYDTELTFSLTASSGSNFPGITQPTVQTTGDPNYGITWDFVEFSSDVSTGMVFGNISYVDFFSIPVALDLTGSGGSQHVSGTDQNGLGNIANALNAQQGKDNVGWNGLIVNDSNGNVQRILSVNTALAQGNTNNGFSTYYDNYISQVWSQYTGEQLTVEASDGTVTGQVANGTLSFSDGTSFAQPASVDIWSCSSGPFTNSGSAAQLSIIPILAAAFNRSTILADTNLPADETVSQYYAVDPTNYYAKILHATFLDGNGYTFPYDDNTPPGQPNVAGVVNDTGVTNFTVTIGGNGAHT